MTPDHIDDIDSYVSAVLSGERPACKWERLAVERHVNDLARSESDEFPYRFDEQLAIKICKFSELFPHVKGKWANRVGRDALIKLEPWQKFNLGMIFGWVHKTTGLRKHRIVYLCIPRKNAKSVKAAIIGLYMMAADNEYGAEIYCGATSEKQALEVFRPAKKMAEKKPGYRAAYGVTCHAKKLEVDSIGIRAGKRYQPDGSRFEPVIGKPGDGASPSCAILDEVHEHPDDTLYDTMLTGMGAREQPLLLMVTTAGSNIAGPCYAQQREVEAMLDGTEPNEELYGIIYTVDDAENEWRTEEGIIKANPNAGVSVGLDFLRDRVRDAERSARKRSTILTKHFNIWVTAKNAWLNMLDWARAGDTTLSEQDFVGEKASLGLDLSETDDLTAAVKCFKRIVDGKAHYYFFGRYYTTEAKAQDNKHYDEWIRNGHLEECEGETIDTEQVEADVLEDAQVYKIEQCFYDPYGAVDLANRLDKGEAAIEAVKVQQSFTNFSAPMRDFERLLKSGRIHHDGNPCLAWMFGNVVAKETADGKMMRPVKENRDAKIDGAVAALLAFIDAYQPEDESDGDLDDFIQDMIIV